MVGRDGGEGMAEKGWWRRDGGEGMVGRDCGKGWLEGMAGKNCEKG